MSDRKYSTRSIPSVWRTVPVGIIWMGGSLDSLEGFTKVTYKIRFPTDGDPDSASGAKWCAEGDNRRTETRGHCIKRFIKKIMPTAFVKKISLKINVIKEKDMMREQRRLVIDDLIAENNQMIGQFQNSLKELRGDD